MVTQYTVMVTYLSKNISIFSAVRLLLDLQTKEMSPTGGHYRLPKTSTHRGDVEC